MMLKLYTETVIDGAHYLKNYDGACKRLHGHSWVLQVWIKGDEKYKNEVGILFDFSNIKKIKEKYDHFRLNDIPPFDKINPTAENISKVIYKDLKTLYPNLNFKIRLYETKVGKETYCELGDFE